MRILQSIMLGIKLSATTISFVFRSRNFKVSLAASILIHFAKSIKHDVNFLATRKEQRKLIPQFARMSRLINDALESNEVSQEGLSNIVSNNNDQRVVNSDKTKEIIESFSNIKSVASLWAHFNEFLENAKKSWEANDSRNIKSGNSTKSRDDTLNATKDSGGYFFIALAYLLNPKSLNKEMQKAIYSSGVWFQFLDDYRDRKEDAKQKSTLFTISQNESLKRLLKKYAAESEKEIKKVIGERHALIRFMESLAQLVLFLDFTKHILDWK